LYNYINIALLLQKIDLYLTCYCCSWWLFIS